ncbi:MAG: hypothetical protein ACTH0V_00285 [Microbacteriaceae bacterium]
MFVEVEVHGRAVRWEDGLFSGDPEIARFAWQASNLRLRVPVNGRSTKAGNRSPVEALAAIAAFAGGAHTVVKRFDIRDSSTAQDLGHGAGACCSFRELAAGLDSASAGRA